VFARSFGERGIDLAAIGCVVHGSTPALKTMSEGLA
jgi:hypothetical protein